MARKRIFTVGFELPRSEFEYVPFSSDQSLLDADITLYKTTLGKCQCERGREFYGRPVLTTKSAIAKNDQIRHWREEILRACKAGRLIIVYLAKEERYYRRFKGDKHGLISSYDPIPEIRTVTPKSGNKIRVASQATYLRAYWEKFSQYSSYQVEIEGDFDEVILRPQDSERVVGALSRIGEGCILFLPPLHIYEELILNSQGSNVHHEEAKLKKQLFSVLKELSDRVNEFAHATQPPDWCLTAEYRLSEEDSLETKVGECLSQLEQLEVRKNELIKELEEVGSLRRLLFEQGKPLEDAVLEAMELFGFHAEKFAEGDSEFDGVFVSDEGRCLGEAEGRDNRAVDIRKFSQLHRNLSEDLARDEVEECAKGILFGNAHRLLPVEKRSDFFTSKCISAAKQNRVALVRTPDLFFPAKYLKEHPSDIEFARRCREAIFAAEGEVVEFPVPPKTKEKTRIETSNLTASDVLSDTSKATT